MTIALFVESIFFCLAVLAVISFFLRRQSGRTQDELKLLLRHIEMQLVENLFDPREEARLRSDMSVPAFRSAQRARLRGLKEQVGRFSHNASLFLEWSNHEYSHLAAKNRTHFDTRDDLLVRVIEIAGAVKSYAFRAAFKIHVWRVLLLVPGMPAPSLSELREIRGRDIVHAYEQLKGVVGQLSLMCGVEQFEVMDSAL